jgi:hypothetical protein
MILVSFYLMADYFLLTYDMFFPFALHGYNICLSRRQI